MERIGSYEIVRKIGEGGFGRTYEGRHILLPDVKACLKQNIEVSLEDKLILEKEASILAKIHHHSLPAFRDFIARPDGSYVLIMSYIEGKRLDKSVEKHQAINPEDIAWVTQRLLNATYFLHRSGIIHGDIKPSNIIVQPHEDNAYLVDFGLSSFKPKATTQQEGFTPIFVAPEIQEGRNPIPESDLYSLGLSMIYALGGNVHTKIMPEHVPKQLQQFYLDLTQFSPLQRPDEEKVDLVAKLSEIRKAVFGRASRKG